MLSKIGESPKPRRGQLLLEAFGRWCLVGAIGEDYWEAVEDIP
jgi:hypothetical protein